MSKLEKHISDMDNIEIKEKMLMINQKQLENIKKASYFNAFQSLIHVRRLLEDKLVEKEYEFKEEKDTFNNHIEILVNSVKQSMDEENSEKDRLDDLKKIRNNLYEIYCIAGGYLIELSYLGELIDECGIKILAKRDYGSTTYDIKLIDELITTINQLLTEKKENYNEYIYIISEIISILPMKLTRKNYQSIIKDTLMRNFKTYNISEVEVHINDYKKKFNSSTMDGYGTKLDYYFREIQKLKNMNLEEIKLAELGELVEKTIDLNREINETMNIILVLGLISNMNIVICLAEDILLDPMVKEIYNEWNNILETKDQEKTSNFMKMVEREIKSVENDILRDLEEFQILNLEGFKREGFSYDELDNEFLYTKDILTYYNDSIFNDHNIMFPDNEEEASHEFLEESVDSLIQHINRSTNNMNNNERRIRMRKLLSITELPFSGIDDFSKYIRYSLNDRVSNTDEINFKINHIRYFLDEFLKISSPKI